jgi:hypothetical protein
MIWTPLSCPSSLILDPFSGADKLRPRVVTDSTALRVPMVIVRATGRTAIDACAA